MADAQIQQVTPIEAAQASDNDVIIDVREDYELLAIRLDNTKINADIKHIPLGQIPTRIEEILTEAKKYQNIYCLCRGGVRSQNACDFLAAQNMINLHNISGGIMAWQEQQPQSLVIAEEQSS